MAVGDGNSSRVLQEQARLLARSEPQENRGQQGTGTGTRRWVGGHCGHTVLLLGTALGQLQREVLVSALQQQGYTPATHH